MIFNEKKKKTDKNLHDHSDYNGVYVYVYVLCIEKSGVKNLTCMQLVGLSARILGDFLFFALREIFSALILFHIQNTEYV